MPLTDLFDDLVTDEWRQANPFTDEVQRCNEKLLAARNDDERARDLNDWITDNQPCFFGRFAAKKGQIDYCILSESDLGRDDHSIAAKIAMKRHAWRKRARRGESHGFVILALSEQLTFAEPNQALLRVAKKIAELYLCREVGTDRIQHDELFLEAAESRSWMVGVNFFGAQGDGRWWKDHRIPGGIAFSMNSVGHMACVRRISKNHEDVDQSKGLHWALQMAMQLIDATKPGISGRNTWLQDVADFPEEGIVCPAMPELLAGKNRCQYSGLYHTDASLPSDFFEANELRADKPFNDNLNLTYLFDDSPDNPDYYSMGLGTQLE